MSRHAPGPALLAHLVDETEVACAVRTTPDTDWQFTPGLNNLLGRLPAWTREDATAWQALLHRDDRTDFLNTLTAFTQGAPFPTQSLRLHHASGDWRRCTCKGSTRDGIAMLVFHDTTGVQQVEAALLDSQMRFRGMYDATPVAMLTWSREGRITDWNLAASETFGHPREVVIGKKLVPLLIHADDYAAFAEALKPALEGQGKSRIVCRSLNRDGQVLLCEWRSVALRSAKGNLIGLMSMALDVTAQHQAESSLRQSRDMAEQLALAKTQFMATISHELRTPLNGILGLAYLLREMLSDAEQRQFAAEIEDNGRRLLEIINAIVSFTDIDATPPEAGLVDFAPLELLQMLADRHAVAAQRRGLAARIELDPALARPLRGEPRALERVLGNLLDNAARFTEAGEVHLQARLEEDDSGVPRLHCVIADTGVGIDPEFIAHHLYTPFKQAENALTRKHGGVGLGLALARRLIDRMQGEIELASTVGVGTTVTLRIPLQRV